MQNRLSNVRQELWAQHFSVLPNGLIGSDGEPAIRPTAQEAGAICQIHESTNIAWINFSLFVNEIGREEEHPIGESFIATGLSDIRQVVFEPVSTVIERGALTKHIARWVGCLATGEHTEKPNRFDELVALLK